MIRIVILLLLSLHLDSVATGEKYAFIVGVGGYNEKYLTPLGEFPRNDAIALRDLLVASGYRDENVVLMVDDSEILSRHQRVGRYLPEARKIRAELDLLLPNLSRDDSLVIALMGHGVQFRGDKEPYFCPLDARLDDKRSLMPLSWLYKRLEYDAATDTGCKPRQKLLLVDACRNDPASAIHRSAARGPGLESVTLPQLTPLPEGIVALFSCAEGQQALQHEPLRHGVFFYHVLEGLRGKADGDGDQKVTLDEVIAYTKARTTAYARVHLASHQTPRQKGFFNGVWELRSLDAKQVLTNSLGMKLRLIPAGEFWMGSTDAQVAAAKKLHAEGWYGDEQPRHRVRITRDFYLGAHEVTKEQFAQFVRETGFKTDAESDGAGGQGYEDSTDDPFASDEEGEPDWVVRRGVRYTWQNTGFPYGNHYPVVNVSWNDAVAFCEWLSKKEGQEYRLPTEAQWEYACRAGSETLWHYGDDPEMMARYGNVADATARSEFPGWDTITAHDGHVFTAPIGSFRANGWGLHDMHGNVWEWCFDAYDAEFYHAVGWDSLEPLNSAPNVIRGGAWDVWPAGTRSSNRSNAAPQYRSVYVGFRVSRTK